MKNSLFLCLLSFSLFSANLVGQEKPIEMSQESKTRVGVGISLEPLKLFAVGSSTFTNAQTPVNIYVPIRTSSSLTIEPEFGVFSGSSESSSGGSTSKSSASVIRLGAGVLATVTSSTTARVYAGPRLGIYLVSSESSSSSQFGSSSSEASETDVTISGCVGGEYFISEQMTIGGEALVTYYSFGEPSRTPAPTTSSSLSRSLITSNMLFFLRWYF